MWIDIKVAGLYPLRNTVLTVMADDYQSGVDHHSISSA